MSLCHQQEQACAFATSASLKHPPTGSTPPKGTCLCTPQAPAWKGGPASASPQAQVRNPLGWEQDCAKAKAGTCLNNRHKRMFETVLKRHPARVDCTTVRPKYSHTGNTSQTGKCISKHTSDLNRFAQQPKSQAGRGTFRREPACESSQARAWIPPRTGASHVHFWNTLPTWTEPKFASRTRLCFATRTSFLRRTSRQGTCQEWELVENLL